MSPIQFRYLLPKPGRISSDVLLDNYDHTTLVGKIVVWDSHTYKFMVFHSPVILYTYILSLPENERTLNEVIFGNRRHRIHFDIDGATEAAYDRILKTIKYIWETSAILPNYNNRKNIRILEFDTGGAPMSTTISRHVIFTYFIPNNAVMKLIFDEVCEHLVLQKNEDERYLDNIYGSLHNLRIMLCRKYYNDKLGPPKVPISRGFDFADSLVQP